MKILGIDMGKRLGSRFMVFKKMSLEELPSEIIQKKIEQIKHIYWRL